MESVYTLRHFQSTRWFTDKPSFYTHTHTTEEREREGGREMVFLCGGTSFSPNSRHIWNNVLHRVRMGPIKLHGSDHMIRCVCVWGGDNLLTNGCVVGRYRLTGTPSALQRNWRGYENHLNIGLPHPQYKAWKISPCAVMPCSLGTT